MKTIQSGVLLGTAKRLQLQRGSEALQLLGIATVLLPVLALLADGGAASLGSLEQWMALLNRASALGNSQSSRPVIFETTRL